MIKKITLNFLFLISFISALSAQNEIRVPSPNGQLLFMFGNDDGHPEYSIRFKNTSLIEHSNIGLSFIMLKLESYF